jgi:hypothetical protein
VRSRSDEAKVVSEQTVGLTLYLDPSKVEGDARTRVRELLTRALESLEKPQLAADQAR